MDVDIVELDQKVVEFATKYFELPQANHVHIGDGRHYLDHIAKENTYDYVVHDVFTNGGIFI